jgi:acyl-CoA thioester hydrolase
MPSNPLEPAPLVSPTQTVIEDWIDYNGHLNMAFYNVIFDRAVDHFYDLLGVGAQYAGSGAGSCFTMEVHVHYLNEVSLYDELELHLQLLDYDSKRLHYFQQMYHKEQGYLAATSEQLALHVDLNTRRSGAFPQHVLDKLDAMAANHLRLEAPSQVGHLIGIKRK